MALSAIQIQRNVAAAQAKHHPGSPQHHEAVRDLAALNLEQYVSRIVDKAPPLTAEQFARLLVLLAPKADH